MEFYESELKRVIRDLQTEADKEQPDWSRVLSKAYDLEVTGRIALKRLGSRKNG